MRRRVALGAVALAFVASALACIDLFHATDDVKSICETDATDPRCLDGGDAAPPATLCAPDAAAAQAMATHACAWLSACEHPVGQNKTGACMVNAILAYDCAANPNRKPKGKVELFWQCMQNANTCNAVAACVFPDGVPGGCLSGGFIGCSQSMFNLDSRLDCEQPTDAAPPGENCGAYGQTCDSIELDASNRNALCVGPQRRACVGLGCSGTKLSLCDDAGIDLGYDCAGFGAGTCFASGASPACKPEGSGTCSGTADVTCSPGNVEAQGCIANIPETVDCTALSGKGTCVPIEGGVPGTVPAAACHIADGGCSDDSCAGASLLACVRGRVVTVDCTKLGLKSCNVVSTVESPPSFATCTAP